MGTKSADSIFHSCRVELVSVRVRRLDVKFASGSEQYIPGIRRKVCRQVLPVHLVTLDL